MPIPGLKKAKPCALLLLSALLMGALAPLLRLMDSELGAALMTVSAWTLLPLLSLFVPLYCCARGCEKYLAFFPHALFTYAGWLLLRLPMPPFTALASLLLGILGSVTGEQMYLRRLAKDKR